MRKQNGTKHETPEEMSVVHTKSDFLAQKLKLRSTTQQTSGLWTVTTDNNYGEHTSWLACQHTCWLKTEWSCTGWLKSKKHSQSTKTEMKHNIHVSNTSKLMCTKELKQSHDMTAKGKLLCFISCDCHCNKYRSQTKHYTLKNKNANVH